MTVISKKLFNPALLQTEEQAFYETPQSAKTVIKYLTVHNTGTEPVGVTIYSTPSGGIAELSNQVFKRNIAGQDTVTVSALFNATMEQGDTIRALASVADVVSIHGSGVEIV